MQLVDVMEADIGCPVEQWPSNILRLLFGFQPHIPNSLTNLHLIIAFFFGNNVRLDVACRFFAACTSLPFFMLNTNLLTHMTNGLILQRPTDVSIII